MAIIYFGNNTNPSNYQNLNGTNWNEGQLYQCSGSGNQRVEELGAQVLVMSGTGLIRCAIYDTNNLFLMQGSEAITVTETEYQWKSHLSFVDILGNPISSPTLTGGNYYRLAITGSGATVRVRAEEVFYGYCKYVASDFTGGFPAELSGSDATKLPAIRCGVRAMYSLKHVLFKRDL